MKKFILGLIWLITLDGANMNTLYSKEKTASASSNKAEKATFAGGCFWCMQPPYDKLKECFPLL